ncbi:hypothetical protein BSL78_19830 [Apostichopus japonicus]|uniref:Ig-like domain-containing protein n=1 Tax=Stichopus japonicus TaxID=307972 RepID=A0A2G8K5T5_STIJA|nr:hypothetical protein BSL78_19830 [Apostichopus japonicus]
MESTYNLRLVSYFMYGTIIHILLVTSVQTTSVHLGPAEGFRNVSDVIFPGELFVLQCMWDGLTTCNISMSFNDTAIYEEGGFQSNDYVFTTTPSSCSLNIGIETVTCQHKGIYKCLVQNGDTRMENTYELNVVTESPQCLAKFNEYENSFQLVCYTVSYTGSTVFQTWNISKPGGGSIKFTDFSLTSSSSSVSKSVGISKINFHKENLTGEYKCSHYNTLSKSCCFNFNSSRQIDVCRPTVAITDFSTIHPTTKVVHASSTHTPLIPSEEPLKPIMKSKGIIIGIVVSTVVFLIIAVCLTTIICKTKCTFGKSSNVNESYKKNDFLQAGTVLGKLSANPNQGLSSYNETQSKRQIEYLEDKNNWNTMNREGKLPEDLYKKVEKRSVRHDVRQSTSHGIEEYKHKSSTTNDEDEVPDDLYAKVKKRSTRYQANQLRDTQCEPYSIVDIDTLTFLDDNFQNDSSINTNATADCSVYEPCEDNTEDEIHYDVLDPSKNETLT